MSNRDASPLDPALARVLPDELNNAFRDTSPCEARLEHHDPRVPPPWNELEHRVPLTHKSGGGARRNLEHLSRSVPSMFHRMRRSEQAPRVVLSAYSAAGIDIPPHLRRGLPLGFAPLGSRARPLLLPLHNKEGSRCHSRPMRCGLPSCCCSGSGPSCSPSRTQPRLAPGRLSGSSEKMQDCTRAQPSTRPRPAVPDCPSPRSSPKCSTVRLARALLTPLPCLAPPTPPAFRPRRE